jgi:hypothetical protein
LAINQLFAMAGINLGYAVELALKFVLLLNGYQKPGLYKHEVSELYADAVSGGFIPPLRTSEDFLLLVDERLNSRYPSMITNHLAQKLEDGGVYAFAIDMLHCYDDFILQLDDAIVAATKDCRASIGFRSCRELQSARGRIFFHCNDHAFGRISRYQEMLASTREPGDEYEALAPLLREPAQLWNFPGLLAYRPWGPKKDWWPASEFRFPRFEGNQVKFRTAQWRSNVPNGELYFAGAVFTLPAGEYQFRWGDGGNADSS